MGKAVFGFEIIKRVGGGHFSDVYQVNGINDEHFVFKVIDTDDERPPHNVRNEIKIMNKLRENAGFDSISTDNINKKLELGILKGYNKNVAVLHGVFYNQIEFGLCLDFYPINLDRLVKSYTKSKSIFGADGQVSYVKKNLLSIEDSISILKGILNGLSWIHSCGIIHRDVNPSNIMFQYKSQGEMIDFSSATIIDFGISYLLPNNNGLEDSKLKFTDIATGHYKAPELLLSKRDYNETVDIWAVGILMTLLGSDNGRVIFEEDAAMSDLVLLSNILKVFGSPSSQWEDCRDLKSFEAMNSTFFSKVPMAISSVMPKFSKSEKLQMLFRGLTCYETKERWSATKSFDFLL